MRARKNVAQAGSPKGNAPAGFRVQTRQTIRQHAVSGLHIRRYSHVTKTNFGTFGGARPVIQHAGQPESNAEATELVGPQSRKSPRAAIITAIPFSTPPLARLAWR